MAAGPRFLHGGPGALSASDAAAVIAASADIALVIDADGIVTDMAFGDPETARAGLGDWTKRAWADCVSDETRGKVAEMLADPEPRWRQVNHPAATGFDVPVRYRVSALAGSPGKRVAIGRDLRAAAALQQRVLQASQAMERDRARTRSAESRYRLLFERSGEALVIADQSGRRVLEFNPAAHALAGDALVTGAALGAVFEPDERERVAALLGAAAASGQAAPIEVALSGARGTVALTATPFRQDGAGYFLVRLSAEREAMRAGAADAQSRLRSVIERMPDAFCVTDGALTITHANAAFLDLAEAAREADVAGVPIGRFLGRPGIDVNLMLAELGEHRLLRGFATFLRGLGGSETEVEVSAVAVLDQAPPAYGFALRASAARAEPEPAAADLPRSVEHLTELVGRVPLREIVRESTDLIERLCIEAALAYTSDNRASAAEILGLSRQSLYSKLHRHGLGDLTDPS